MLLPQVLGREPSEGLMRGLQERAEALLDTLNAQHLGNILWSACVFSCLHEPVKEAGGWVREVAQRLIALDGTKDEGLEHCTKSQLHQFFVWCVCVCVCVCVYTHRHRHAYMYVYIYIYIYIYIYPCVCVCVCIGVARKTSGV